MVAENRTVWRVSNKRLIEALNNKSIYTPLQLAIFRSSWHFAVSRVNLLLCWKDKTWNMTLKSHYRAPTAWWIRTRKSLFSACPTTIRSFNIFATSLWTTSNGNPERLPITTQLPTGWMVKVISADVPFAMSAGRIPLTLVRKSVTRSLGFTYLS